MGGQKDWQELVERYAFTAALLPVETHFPSC